MLAPTFLAWAANQGATEGSLLTFDTGASHWFTGDPELLVGFVEACDVPVSGVGSGCRAVAVGRGRAVVSGGMSFDIPQLWYVPTLGNVTLGAISEMVESGMEFVVSKRTGENAMAIARDGEELLVVPAVGGLYTAHTVRGVGQPAIFASGVQMHANLSANLGYVAGVGGALRSNCYTGGMGIAELAHRRFAHVSWGNQRLARRLRAVLGKGAGVGHNCGACESCMLAKMHRIVSRAEPSRPAQRPLHRVHFDLSGRIPVKGVCGGVYFLTIVDEFTRYVEVVIVQSKSEVLACLQKFTETAQRHFRQRLGEVVIPVELASLRSDRESVNVCERVREWCESLGVKHELSAAYSQWQNGVAERTIRTVWEGAEAIRKDAGWPLAMWPLSVRAFVHVFNRLALGEKDVSPYERWHMVPIPLLRRVQHLRIIGCLCYALVPKELRVKGADKARICMHLGYATESKAYSLMELTTGKVFVATSVVFDETKMVFKCPDLLSRVRGAADGSGAAAAPELSGVAGPAWDAALGGAVEVGGALRGGLPDGSLHSVQVDGGVAHGGEPLDGALGGELRDAQVDGGVARGGELPDGAYGGDGPAMRAGDEGSRAGRRESFGDVSVGDERRGIAPDLFDLGGGQLRDILGLDADPPPLEPGRPDLSPYFPVPDRTLEVRQEPEEQQWEVERVTQVRARVMDGEDPETGQVVLEYRVKWVDSPRETWVGHGDLLGAPDALHAYETSSAGRRAHRQLARRWNGRLNVEAPMPDGRRAMLACMRAEVASIDPGGTAAADEPEETRFNGEVCVPRYDAPLARVQLGLIRELSGPQDAARNMEAMARRIELLALAAKAKPGERKDPRRVVFVPHTLFEAENSEEWSCWQEAMDAEMDSMREFGVWKLVPAPVGANLMSCKWVFALKRNKLGEIERFKARLTARGFTQREGVDFDETWAPTARGRSFRMMMAEASADARVQTRQWDVTCAFLHAAADTEMYMRQPPRYEIPGDAGERLVCKLLKAIYGCKQASRLFHVEVREKLLDLGAVQAKADECLFIFKEGSDWMRVLCHVDDFAVTFTSQSLYDRVFSGMVDRFKLTDYEGEPLSKFLGICMERDDAGRIRLHQGPYIDELLDRLGMAEAQPARSPERPGSKNRLRPTEMTAAERDFMATVPYKEAVGALFYLARCTRFDIAHATSQVAAFMADPAPVHWDAVCRIYRYLKSTRELALNMASSGMEVQLVDQFMDGFCDADWAGCPYTRKSCTGWLVRVGGSVVSWYSKRQSSISQSSTEAEYVAAAALANEVVWWRRLCTDLGYDADGPVTLWCDNRATSLLADHEGKFDAVKHIQLRYHVLRDYQKRGIVKVKWCAAARQWADVLTKNCDVAQFRRVTEELMGEAFPAVR